MQPTRNAHASTVPRAPKILTMSFLNSSSAPAKSLRPSWTAAGPHDPMRASARSCTFPPSLRSGNRYGSASRPGSRSSAERR